MPLTATQSQNLRDAMLMGQFAEEDYVVMMCDQMQIRVREQIAFGPLAAVAFNLVTWCDGQGLIDELSAAIVAHRPLNPTVRGLVADLRAELGLPALPSAAARPLPAAPVPASPAALLPDTRPLFTRVRQLLYHLYPDRSKLAMLLEDNLGQNYEVVTGIPTPEAEIRKLVHWADENRAFRLRPLLAAVIADHPDAQELVKIYQEL